MFVTSLRRTRSTTVCFGIAGAQVHFAVRVVGARLTDANIKSRFRRFADSSLVEGDLTNVGGQQRKFTRAKSITVCFGSASHAKPGVGGETP